MEGRAGVGAKMSAKSRMEDCGVGEAAMAQKWARPKKGRSLACLPQSCSFSPLFISQTSTNDPSPLYSVLQFIKCFLIHLVPDFHNNPVQKVVRVVVCPFYRCAT